MFCHGGNGCIATKLCCKFRAIALSCPPPFENFFRLMPKGFSDGLFSCCAPFGAAWHDMTFSGRISQISDFSRLCFTDTANGLTKFICIFQTFCNLL